MIDFTVLTAAIVVTSASIYILACRLRQTQDTLDRVRFATVELTSMLDDQVKDLQTSLVDAGIPLSTTRTDERARRNALSPEQRHAESVARFEATVADVEAMRRRIEEE